MHGRRYLFAPADVDLRRTEPDRRRTRWAATGLLVLLLAVTVYLPLIRMMTQIRSVDVLRRAVETAGGDAVSTLAWSACAATMALVVAIPFGAFLAHSRRGASVILSLLCWLPIAVPGTVVGLGVATVWGIVAHGGSHDAIGVRLVIAYVAAFMPIAVFVVAAATGRIEPTVDEIAALDGAGWAQRFFHVTLPIHWPALLGAWMLVFVLSVGELNSAVLLVPPGRSTLAVTIDNLLHYGANPVATVLCVSEALLCLVPLASVATIWYVVARKRCERPF